MPGGGGGAPVPEGAFVRTLFPTDERPHEPGLLHVCYCLVVTTASLVVAYTSSQPWPAGTPVAAGVRVFAEAEASALSQRPFVLYLNRLAALPISQRWFPGLGTPGNGIVAIATAALRKELYATSKTLLLRHRETVRMSGPI